MQAKKQASMGKPSTAMYTCKECGHYVFPDDEHVCEDDAPPPPPPKADSKPKEESKEPAQEAAGANALCQPAFAGTMNRGAKKRNSSRQPPAPAQVPQQATPMTTMSFEEPSRLDQTVDES
jgi:hypothetical protein